MIQRGGHVSLSVALALLMTHSTVFAASDSNLNFKVYNPSPNISETNKKADSEDMASTDAISNDESVSASSETQTTENTATENTTTAENTAATETTTSTESTSEKKETTANASTGKILQGYIRVVPSGTKVPIIMDTAVDSDTSQEGDEFAARTAEDLNIDGTTIVPAGSVIKGRIAQLNSPRHLNRSGSVALKFDTVTTPDNRQIPIVANIVARGGVVHAKRGLKDIAMDTGTFALPTTVGLGIGVLAGGSSNGSSGIGRAGGALIGAGIGAGIGIAILLAKKGKKVDVRPGDELKIELAEDLRMPM
jgi:hypothetical protein